MKKVLFIACFAIFCVFSMNACVYAASIDMTAEDFIATASNGTITLTEDVTLTTNLVVPNTVEVIDLGGKTLTAKGVFDYGKSNPIYVNSKLEIKNGTISRHNSLIRGSLIVVEGNDAKLTLNNVVIDGKEVNVEAQGSKSIGTAGVFVKTGASFVANNSTFQNNVSGMYGGAFKASEVENITFSNCTIKNNYAKNSGSAMGIEGAKSVVIEKTIISDNTGDNNGTVSIQKVESFTFDKDSVVKNNKAKEGAGIHIADSNGTIEGTIEGNEATKTDGNGGGLYTMLSNSTKTVTITETAVIKNNIAGGAGGGVYVNGSKANAATGNVIMNGGLITGNTAKGTPNATTLKDGGGAGVYVSRGTMTINGGTIEKNTSTSGIGNGILVSHAGGNTEAGKLEINGGYIDGEIALAESYGDVEVTGGAFTDDIADYLATGLTKVEIDGVYYVGTLNKVNVKETENGKVEVSLKEAIVGQTVKVTATANEGYELNTITVKDAAGKNIEVVNGEFVMPDAEVTVEVSFKALELDNTPATGYIDTLLFASIIVSAIAVVAIAKKKQDMKNLV